MRREKFAEDMKGVEDSVGVLALVLQPVNVTVIRVVCRCFEHVGNKVIFEIVPVIKVIIIALRIVEISLEHVSAAVLYLAESVALVYVVYGRIAL